MGGCTKWTRYGRSEGVLGQSLCEKALGRIRRKSSHELKEGSCVWRGEADEAEKCLLLTSPLSSSSPLTLRYVSGETHTSESEKKSHGWTLDVVNWNWSRFLGFCIRRRMRQVVYNFRTWLQCPVRKIRLVVWIVGSFVGLQLYCEEWYHSMNQGTVISKNYSLFVNICANI